MGLPKGFIKNLRISPQTEGPAKRQEILDDINNNGPFLPSGVEIEDLDSTFFDFIDDDLELTLDGEKVPVFILTIQRWAEFTKTWDFTDKFKELQLPFISIVRQPDIQEGTNQMGMWNIPGRNTYTYLKVPTFEGGRKGVDLYKIPQPTPVDVTYEVRLFCNRMIDLNKFHKKVRKAFNSRQFYISVKGHPMPVVLESVGDESPIEEENRRFYIQEFEMLLSGYILDEDDFEVIPTLNRGVVFTELKDNIQKPIKNVNNTNGVFSYEFIFSCSDDTSVNIIITDEINVSAIVGMINADTPLFTLNGNPITLPFNVEIGDNVNIKITRDITKDSRFELIGKTNE